MAFSRLGRFVRLCYSLLFCFLLHACLVPAVRAQVDRTGLNGTVTDSSGRVVPGVHIAALQDDTKLLREAVSSASGYYDLAELPVGTYTVTFSLTGFEDLTFTNVTQTIGQTRTLNATLAVSGRTERIEVSGSSEQLDETSDALGAAIEPAQVKELPLNGRNWATLTALAPGAVDTGGSNQRSIRFAGRGRDDDNFTYDGIDATNIINQAQQPYVRLAIPLDTIEEFRVNSMLATPEAGATGGPQLAVTSPSGTNQFHGDAFEFLRNNAFDAQVPVPVNAVDPAQPPFRLNQFGGALGGPIATDKTFFFVAYEGYRQVLGQTLLGFVPSDSFRAQVAAESPVLLPILNAYPHGQSLVSPTVAQWIGQGSQNVHEDSGMFRVDHRFSDKTTIFLRANIDEALSAAPLASSGAYLQDQQQLTSSPVNAVIEGLHIFSPSLLNEFKFGFNRSTGRHHQSQSNGSALLFRRVGLYQPEQRQGQHRGRQLLLRDRQPHLAEGTAHAESGSGASPRSTEPRQFRQRHGFFRLRGGFCGGPSQYRHSHRGLARQRLAQDAVLRYTCKMSLSGARTSPSTSAHATVFSISFMRCSAAPIRSISPLADPKAFVASAPASGSRIMAISIRASPWPGPRVAEGGP